MANFTEKMVMVAGIAGAIALGGLVRPKNTEATSSEQSSGYTCITYHMKQIQTMNLNLENQVLIRDC